MDIFSPTIIDNAIITGSNTANLLRVSSPSATNALFVSGSGTVAIGTSTPSNAVGKLVMGLDGDGNGIGFYNGTGTSLRIWRDSDIGYIGRGTNPAISINASSNVGIGETSPSAKLEIRGSGATSSTTALRVENSSAAASLTILDDGTSAFNTNHLYVSGSGNVGIGTGTPVHNLVVNGNTGVSINANGATFPNIHRDSADGGMLLRSWNGSIFTTNVKITPTTEVGIGTTSPTAELHVSGASADALFRVSSPSAASALFVSGSGNIGIGTGTPLLGVLDVNGAVRIRSTNQLYFGGTGAGDWQGAISGQASGLLINANLVTINNSGYASPATQSFVINTSQNIAIGPHSPTARLHVSGASNAGLFKIDSPAVNNIIYVSGSGNVGIGTGTPTNTLQVVGGITATSITSSLLGTASVSVNAQTASFLPIGTYNITSSWAQSASNAVNAQTASFLPIGTYSITSSWATNALTASNITPSITNNTDNRVLTATGGGTINGETNLTFDGSVLTVTGRANISTSITSSTATIGFGLTSALNAGQTTIRSSGVDTVGALTIQNSGGTGTFTVLNGGTTGVGENNPSARLHVKGSGATSATTALRVENSSAVARLTILDDGTSAFNTSHLYVSGSGLVGIGTATPSAQLHISGSATTPLRIQNPATTLMQISSSVANSGSIVFFGTTPTAAGLDLEIQSNGAANGGQVRIAGNGTQWDFGSVSAVARNGTGNSEMFSATMTGTSTTLVQNPVRIQFNANQSSAGGGGYTVLRLNATHASTAGTGSKLLQTWEFGGVAQSVMDISGSLGIGTGSAPSARLFISGASNQALFEIDSPAVNNIIYVSGSGNVGIGTNLPSAELHISGASADNLLRVGSPTQANILFVTGSGRVGVGTTTPSALFEVNNKIIAEAAGNVGIQTTPSEWIHLSSDPTNNKYLRIDAAQSGNPPPDYGASGGGGVDRLIGNTQDNYALGTPDYWMEIKLNGAKVLIPAYLPGA